MEDEKKLYSFSTVEEDFGLDDVFGNFGFKDEDDNIVIKPQYASVGKFSCGLCPVCINRTWYTDEDGDEYYEMHWGYIDTNGKTVIPHKFLEAKSFNKYGLAVVCEDYEKGQYFIDTEGNAVENSRFSYIVDRYETDRRFIEFSLSAYNDFYTYNNGIYDTKERNVLITDIDSFIEFDEEHIKIFERGDLWKGDYRSRFINSKGENIYPWQVGKGFSDVKIPNDHGYSVVAVYEYSDKDIDEKGEVIYKKRKKNCGVIDDKGEFVIPMEYDEIREKEENVFECRKGLERTIIKL